MTYVRSTMQGGASVSTPKPLPKTTGGDQSDGGSEGRTSSSGAAGEAGGQGSATTTAGAAGAGAGAGVSDARESKDSAMENSPSKKKGHDSAIAGSDQPGDKAGAKPSVGASPAQACASVAEVLPRPILQAHEEWQYLALVRSILESGAVKEDRTGTGTFSLFGQQVREGGRERGREAWGGRE